MAILSGDEFRLTYALLLAAAAMVGAWRFVARRVRTDWADRAADALLLFLLVQYASVAVPGVLRILCPLSIAGFTLAFAAGLYFLPVGRRGDEPVAVSNDAPLDRRVLLTCALFVVGYVGTIVVYYSAAPISANDPITYHAPAAVRWLQTGRLGLFETWYFNPANMYSPLAGSAFIAWWIAPVGHDLLAKTVQDPPLLLVFFAAVRLMRGLGVRTAVAAVVAVGLVTAQPLIRQSIMEKDDVALAAFFACAVAGCARERLRDALGPWRVGVAVGMMLATKYTALLAAPVLVLIVDAPFRARWRWGDWAIAVATPLLLAGPWYLRNAVLTGNPLFPLDVRVAGVTLFEGLFSTERSAQLRSFGSVWTVLTGRDQSLPVVPFVVVVLAFLAAVVAAVRSGRAKRDPLVRVCAIGPAVGMIVFLATSPYAEVRFLYPVLVLAYAAAGFAIAAWVKHPLGQLGAGLLILLTSHLTGFLAAQMAELTAGAILVVAVGWGVAWVWRRLPARRRAIVQYGGVAGALVYAGTLYVAWPSHLKMARFAAEKVFYPGRYESLAGVWNYVRDEIPPEGTLAYANTFLVHPLTGFEHRRRLVYVPTRRGVRHIHDLPHFDGRQTGETIGPNVAAAMVADTDAGAWLENLFASGAAHLVVFHDQVVKNPPELEIVRANADRFEQVFSNSGGSVFRLKR